MITWFAEVAVSLRALQNFHGTCAVLSGLDKNAVTRMTATMDRLDPAVHQRLEVRTQSRAPPPQQTHTPHALSLRPAPQELRELYSEANRYKNYRAALKRVAGLRPAVPHLAVHLSDLTFMEDGAPDVLPDSDGMINFGKWQLVASVVALLRSLQRQRYALVPVRARCVTQAAGPTPSYPLLYPDPRRQQRAHRPPAAALPLLRRGPGPRGQAAVLHVGAAGAQRGAVARLSSSAADGRAPDLPRSPGAERGTGVVGMACGAMGNGNESTQRGSRKQMGGH